MAVLDGAGYESYVVGGAVRDIVMGKVPSDYDITTSSTPEETAAALEGAGIRYAPTGLKHGTVMAIIGDDTVEITTFRVDGEYSDMRRPDSVTFTRSIEDDVARRDFTMNAMYLGRDGQIIDRTGGMSDIRSRVIRAVGDPSKRFNEDALRIMRGLRFAAQTGFSIEESTLEAMKAHAHLLTRISGERIAVELNLLVTARYASQVIRNSVPILSVVIPELALCEGFDQRTVFHDKDVLEHILAVLDNIPCGSGGRDIDLALAALFHDIAKPECFYVGSDGRGHMKGHPGRSAVVADRVLRGLRYPNSLREEVVKLVRYHDYFIPAERYSVHRYMSNCGPDFVRRILILQDADIKAHSSHPSRRRGRLEGIGRIAAELTEEGAAFSTCELDISGKDLISMGMSGGPGLKVMLERLFDLYLKGEVANDHEALCALAASLISS